MSKSNALFDFLFVIGGESVRPSTDDETIACMTDSSATTVSAYSAEQTDEFLDFVSVCNKFGFTQATKVTPCKNGKGYFVTCRKARQFPSRGVSMAALLARASE
jgi:hypothetical protein